MEICVSNLKEQLRKFEKKLEEYDTNYLNIYSNLGNSKTSWQDSKANDFFSLCDIFCIESAGMLVQGLKKSHKKAMLFLHWYPTMAK